jgi:hypothetical protein
MRTFYQDRLGTNIGKTPKKDRFSSGRDEERGVYTRKTQDAWEAIMTPGKNTVLLSHFYIKTIILPRQARDKHIEKLKNRLPFSLLDVADRMQAMSHFNSGALNHVISLKLGEVLVNNGYASHI